MKKAVRILFPAGKALLIYLACRVLSGEVLLSTGGGVGLGHLVSLLFPYGLTALLLMAAAVLAVRYAPEPPVRGWERVFAAAVALMWLLGWSFNATDGWGILYDGPVSSLLTAVTFLGLFVLVATALRWLKALGKRVGSWEPRMPKCLERHVFLASWTVILLCWLPFAVIRYPAGIEYDAHFQIEQFLGLQPMTAHWPPFSSMIMGSFVWLGGALFDSYDVGLFAFILFQTLVSSAILAYTVKTMADLGVARVWRLMSVAAYALAVVYPSYLTSAVKDALFSAVTVLFVTLLIRCLYLSQRRGTCVALGVTALLMCLLRKNGVYVLLPCLLVLLLWALIRKNRARLPMIAALAAACLLNFGYEKALLPALDIPAGSVAEALSVPFQQTARYVRDHPEDVTEKEREIIGAVLNYESLENGIYDPDLSDPVKIAYHGDTRALIRYMGVWGSQFFRHPGTYFQATLANSCGFYYPDARNLVFYDNLEVYENLNFSDPPALRPAKNRLYTYVASMDTLPVLMLFGSAGFNTWLTAYFVTCALRRRDKKLLLALLPSVMGILVCVAGPTYTWNGVRYALPYMYATPLLMGLSVFLKGNKKEGHHEKPDSGTDPLL